MLNILTFFIAFVAIYIIQPITSIYKILIITLKPNKMTYFYYQTNRYGQQNHNQEQLEELKKQYMHIADKKNWRIIELPNGYYQAEYKNLENEKHWVDVTRRETIEGAERAIDSSIDHYKKKLRVFEGPKVVKTFK